MVPSCLSPNLAFILSYIHFRPGIALSLGRRIRPGSFLQGARSQVSEAGWTMCLDHALIWERNIRDPVPSWAAFTYHLFRFYLGSLLARETFACTSVPTVTRTRPLLHPQGREEPLKSFKQDSDMNMTLFLEIAWAAVWDWLKEQQRETEASSGPHGRPPGISPFPWYLLDLFSHEERMLCISVKVSELTKYMISPTLPSLIFATTPWDRINSISPFYSWKQRVSEKLSIYLGSHCL